LPHPKIAQLYVLLMVVFVIGLNYKISIFFGFRFNILSELLYLQTQPLG